MEEKLQQNKNTDCVKVVLYGPESTGKSSLAEALAKWYGTVYVKEFSRTYAENKAHYNLQLTKEDVLPIAIGQMQAENEQLKIANRLLICDTDLLETKVYSKHYYDGFCPELVDKYAHENTYDLYFLTYIDTMWEADGIRDQPKNRLQMFTAFEQELIKSKKPYIVVSGTFKQRLHTCKVQIDNLLKKRLLNFSEKDIQQIKNKGITIKKVEQQIEIFENGLPFTNLVSAATIGDGILKLSSEETEHFIALFESKKDSISILKFVPASGAATRMFKFLFQFLEEYDFKKESTNSYINRLKFKDLSLFFIGLEKFPFYQIVKDKLQEEYPNFETLSISEQRFMFVEMMLDEHKLDYGDFPKGLLPFHEYKNQVISTAFEEHLFESALYSSSNEPTKLHFTISEKHNHKFDEEFNRIEKKVEKKTGSKFDISFSYQKESTDTIAVTTKNKPFREDDGTLLFRPSGHGALIENLNDLDADIIFIKNIDNVVVYKYKTEVAKYKKILAGILLEVQEQGFKYLKVLDQAKVSETQLVEIAEFLVNKMNVRISSEFEKYSLKYQIAYLAEKLNRPIRVCGMVKNEGEPGGGPFWIKNEGGQISLQIVESAQINRKNKNQKEILKGATHFNPVDLVCGIKNYQGKTFNLTSFIDHKAAFITMKTKTGKDLKALELPGLWNGSMANWNTIFVEVPLITFNPVKTVNDLLKATHQIK